VKKAPPPSTIQQAMEVLKTSTSAGRRAATKHPKLTELTKPSKPTAPASALSTVYLPQALIDEAKDAVDALSGPPLRLTYSSFAREAFRREIERLKKAHHNGQPFPARSGPMKEGRPRKL
jgi:hypothetical protein